jgi:hypothetical protein
VCRALVGSQRDQARTVGGGNSADGPGQDLSVNDLGCSFLTGVSVRRALNDQLRTGTDKGNLTV